MKKILILSILLIIFSFSYGQNNQSIESTQTQIENSKHDRSENTYLNKIAKIKDIKEIYLSESLLKIIGMLPNIGSPNIKVDNLASKLSELRIYSSTQKGAIKKLQKETNKILKTSDYETFAILNDKMANTSVYKRIAGDGQVIILLTTESEKPKDMKLIRLKGNLIEEDIKSLTKHSTKK